MRRHGRPLAHAAALVVACLCLWTAEARAAAVPNTRVQLPPAMHFFTVPLEPVAGRPAGAFGGSLEVAYSSLFQSEVAQGGRNRFEADFELLTVTPRLAWRPTDRLELGLAIPVHNAGSGFLDRPIQEFHDAFDLPNGGRELVPNDQFRSSLVIDDRLVYEGEQRPGLGDLAVTQAWRLVGGPGSPFRLALRTGVELPTGDADRGYGSGEIDLGAALAMTVEAGGFALHAQALWSLPGDLAGESRVETHAAYGFGAALEAPIVRDRFHLLAQVDARTGFTSGTGLEALDGTLLQLSGGFALRLGRAWLTLGLAEDGRTGTSPDVTFLVRLSPALD